MRDEKCLYFLMGTKPAEHVRVEQLSKHKSPDLLQEFRYHFPNELNRNSSKLQDH